MATKRDEMGRQGTFPPGFLYSQKEGKKIQETIKKDLKKENLRKLNLGCLNVG